VTRNFNSVVHTDPAATKTGADLMKVGVDVTLRGKYVSELMFFEAVEPAQ
jgi:hypothetical protein